MNQFSVYLKLGFEHIADFAALDHILFITALCLRYQFSDWKKIIVLVTAFTIGHSITLALSVFRVIDYPVKWIEFLIPLTIVITAVSNLFIKKFSFRSRFPLIYFLALLFGLVHGLGFSYTLRQLLGRDATIVTQLLGFNIGLELGQLLVVLVVLVISFIFVGMLKASRREFLVFMSGAVFGLAMQMTVERLPF